MQSAPEYARVGVDGVVEDASLTRRHAAFSLDELNLAHGAEQRRRGRTRRPHPGRNRQSFGGQVGERALANPIDVAQPEPRNGERGTRTDNHPGVGRIQGDHVERLGRCNADPTSLANRIVNHAAMPSENTAVDMDDLAGNGGARHQALDHLRVMS